MLKIYRLEREQIVPADLDSVWEFFATPRNLNRLTPSEMHFEILYGDDEPMHEGQIIEYRVQLVPRIRVSWLAEITHVEPKRRFIDEQRLGPYKLWHHEHRFVSVEGGTKIGDRVIYALPFGPLGDLAQALWVRRRLNYIFDFRRQAIAEIFGTLRSQE